MATVKGEVSIKGKRATSGTVVFHSQGYDPVAAKIEANGTYSLKTRTGTNLVTVVGSELEKSNSNGPPAIPHAIEPGENIIDLTY